MTVMVVVLNGCAIGSHDDESIRWQEQLTSSNMEQISNHSAGAKTFDA